MLTLSVEEWKAFSLAQKIYLKHSVIHKGFCLFVCFFTHIYSFKPQETASSLVFHINLILQKEY